MLIHLLIDCQLANCFLVHNPSHTDTSTYSLNLHSLQLRITLTRSFCLSPVLLNLPIMLVSQANLFIFRPFIKLDCPSTFVWKCAHTHHISLSVAVSFHFSARAECCWQKGILPQTLASCEQTPSVCCMAFINLIFQYNSIGSVDTNTTKAHIRILAYTQPASDSRKKERFA